MLNGPAWGQTDMVWSALAALSVAFALRERWAAMMLAFGMAVAFKLQAVFIAPSCSTWCSPTVSARATSRCRCWPMRR
ncbi:hypothetical protein ACFQU7_34105 [Pseudoroseomonas wenyumeiae]